MLFLLLPPWSAKLVTIGEIITCLHVGASKNPFNNKVAQTCKLVSSVIELRNYCITFSHIQATPSGAWSAERAEWACQNVKRKID